MIITTEDAERENEMKIGTEPGAVATGIKTQHDVPIKIPSQTGGSVINEISNRDDKLSLYPGRYGSWFCSKAKA